MDTIQISITRKRIRTPDIEGCLNSGDEIRRALLNKDEAALRVARSRRDQFLDRIMKKDVDLLIEIHPRTHR